MTLIDNPKFQSLKLDVYNSFLEIEKDIKAFFEKKKSTFGINEN